VQRREYHVQHHGPEQPGAERPEDPEQSEAQRENQPGRSLTLGIQEWHAPKTTGQPDPPPALALQPAGPRGEIIAVSDILAAYDALPLMIWTTGPDGQTDYSNAHRLAFTGRPADQEMGWGWIEPVHPDDRAAAREARRQAATGRSVYTAEYRLRRADGEYRWVEDTASPRPTAGSFAGLVGVTQDVTDRRQREQRMRQLQRTEGLTELAHGVAHDFNNLLTGILGHVSLLQEDPTLSPEARGDVARIEQAADRAAGLTRQLLAFSRRQVLAPRALDLNRLVSGTVSAIRSIVGTRIEVTPTLEPDLEPVLADPGQLEEMLLRVASSARDGLPDGGRLEFRTGRLQVDERLAASREGLRPGAFVTFTVRASGPTMDREAFEHLLDPLVVPPGGAVTPGDAPSAQMIVRQSGGYLALDREPDMASAFTLYLPRLEATAERAAPRAESLGGTETILLVEDEEQVRELGRRVLEREGYTVLAAPDAESATALADRHAGHIHLLITDVLLPRVSGRELAARLGIHRPAIKVLYVSGSAEGSLARHRMLEPGTTFLEKPFSLDRLLRSVRRALGAPEAAAHPG
jgi:two-component system cell cycle sensor histidine kinase/response regulator CckA